MSQFSEIVKESARKHKGHPVNMGVTLEDLAMYAGSGGGGGGGGGPSGPSLPPSNPRPAPRANLAKDLARRWGGPSPHPSGRAFDALAGLEGAVAPAPAGPPTDLASILTKKWGGPAAHASGLPFDALAGAEGAVIQPSLKQMLVERAQKGIGGYMEGKVLPAAAAATLGVGGAVVAKEHITPWITEKLSPKRNMIQKLLQNPAARKLLLAGAGATALGGGIALGEKLHGRVSNEMSKRRAFKRLAEHSPELLERDPKHTAELFEALHTFNKDLAKNPLTASSFIKTRLHYKDEGLQPIDVKTLVDIGKAHRESKPKDHFLNKVLGGAASVSGMTGLGVGSLD